MANVSRPRGLSPVGTLTGASYNEQGQLFAVANDATNTYAIGDIVTSSTGSDANGIAYVTKMTADTSLPLGVIVGIRPVDPGVSLQGLNVDLTKLYLSQSSGLRYIYVITDPNVVYEIQADGSMAQTSVGNEYLFTNITSGSSTTGLSQATLGSATAVGNGNQGQMRVVDLGQGVDNAWGDSYTVVRVQLSSTNFFGQYTATV